MIKHIVTFKLTGTPAERKEVANKFKDALMALPLTIDVLKSIEVGINENPSESWDIVLTAVVERNVSQKELAAKIGKSFSTVNAYCANRQQPTLETLDLIAKVLNVPMRTLVKED